MIQTKLLALKHFFERPTFDPESLPAQEVDFLLHLAPKKIDDHYVLTNNSFEILCLLMRIDIKSKCAFPKVNAYLLELARGIFNLRAVNQSYYSKISSRVDFLEFDVINRVNLYLLELLNTFKHKGSLVASIKSIVMDSYVPKFMKLVSEMSNNEKSVEQSLDKNEILWLRSLLKLPMRNPLLNMFKTENIVTTVKTELEKMTKIQVSQQTHDGFYKTGVLLHMFPSLDADVNTLQFMSNYTNTLIKRYLKFEEVNQKLLNPFRLALEVCISFQESLEGYMLETQKTLSLGKLLRNFLTELNGIAEDFYVKFISDILKSIEIVFWRIPSIQEKVKVIDIMFNYYMKCKSFSENVHQMMGDGRHNGGLGATVNINGEAANGKFQSPERKKEETLHRVRTISDLVLNSIFKILDQEDFDGALVDYNNSLVYNFIVHVFNSLSSVGATRSESVKLDQDGHEGQTVKDPRKYEVYGFKFLYHLVKRFQSTRINELIYNLISSRFSLKVSLNDMKHIVNSLDEKAAQKMLVKMKLQMSLNITDNKLFYKSMNELVTYYSEVIEDPRYKPQEAFVYSLFKKLINKTKDEEKTVILWNQLTAFMIRLAKEVVMQSRPESFMQYFAKNLEYLKEILTKNIVKKSSSLPRDPKFIERLIEIWIHIMLQKQNLLKTSGPIIEEIALLTPRLIQASGNSFTNTFLISPFLNNQKIIDKYRRNMKHVLREKMIELRPKIRNLTLGEMMFLLSIDYILDVKIREVARNPNRIVEVKKDIPLIEIIFCYVRDIYITEKENLKEVLEELLIRKTRSYLSQLQLLKQERQQMYFVERDFIAILQSSCSINKIYMKMSQMFLKEFIKEFPRLIFQEVIICSLAETLEFLYGKVLRQYDSVSARLKVSHYNLRIAVPDTLKDLNDLLVFLLAITHSMCLRGFIIEGSTLLKRVNDVLGSAMHKDLKNAIKVFKYLMWTLNNHTALTADTQTRGTAYWFYDRAYFLSKVERFENKHLEEGLKVIAVIPAYSYEIHFDSKATINCLNQTLKEFKYYSETQSELKLLKEKGPTFQKIFHDLKDSLIHFYTYSLIQRDKNYKQNLNEILKDPVLLKIFDKEAKDIISSTTAKPQSIFEKIKLKMDETYANVIANLQLTTSYIKMHPEQAFDILRKVYTLTLALPVRKILKFVIKKLTKNVLSSIPSKYSLEVLRALFFLFQEVIHKYNSYTNIEAVTKKKLYSFDLLEVNSDLFSKIRFKDLFSAGHTYVEICENVNKIFYTCRERESLQIREVRSLFSIRHFIEVFNSVHKDIMMFMYNHLSIFLANYVEPLELMTFLQENFDISKTSIEHLNCENIFATVAVHISVLNLLKTCLQLSPINKRYLQKFYYSTLKLALTYFAKNNKYYVDDTFESENCIQKIEKKMDLAIKACRYLKIETFMETSNTVEKVDIPLKFPHVFLDMNVETPSKTKLLFKFSDHRTQFYFTKLKSRTLGSLGFSRKMKNITAIYDPSTEKKLLLPSVTTLSRFQNLRKVLLVLIGHEIDSIKAFNKTELGGMKYEFSFEDRALNETEAKQLLYFATEINMHLPIYMIRKLAFAIPVSLTGNPNWIRDLVSKYYLFNFPYPITFDYFVEKNLTNVATLRNIFYWETPQFALLMKYMTLEYQGHKNLQIYFAKTIKRLESTQLLFYLPQIYQTLNTEASYVVAQTLKEYSQSSYLFSHQLIWKTKVECRKEKNEKNEVTTSRLTFISAQLLSQLLKGFNRTEKFLFNQVDGFFESVTAISGILNPKTEKKKKEETIRRELEKIFVNEYLYVPSNPQYMIAKIKLDSGRAMQSAAKCPILVSFYCKRFEGPDKYYPKLLNKDKIEAEAAAESEDDPFIESEDHPSIHDLKISSRVKLLPRDRENLTHSDDSHPIPLPAFQPLERIPEKEHEGSPSDVRVKILSKIEEQQKKEVEDPELFPKSMLEEVGTKTKKEEPTPFDFEKQNNNSFEDKDGQNLSGDHNRLEYSVGTSNILPPVGEIPRGELIIDKRYKSSKFTLHQNNFDGKNQEEPVSPGHEVKKNEEKVEEEKYEVISCIFKVFDDIRQDELALQVISLFKHIYQSVGLDLFLYPYRAISNRTGKDLDIGGIIEVVPNTISRDQMGKMMDCSLYEYFIARFGSEKSPEFQLARENFIKSMAAYSIVSYILQIKDRHNGNILIDAYGHIVHIDFGFIFDISPAHNMKFESANFKLTKEMIQIMGGDQATEPFNYFVDQTIKAFLAVRRFDEQLFNMIKLMSYSGLKCFRPMSLQNLKDRFMPRMNELQSATMMKKIILDAYNKLTTNLYDDIQHLQNKIHR